MISTPDYAEIVERAEHFLVAHPRAHVSALDGYGFFVAMPATVRLSAHQIMTDAASAL